MLTHAAGVALDGCRNIFRREKTPRERSFEHKLAMFAEEQKENRIMIGRSLSFGLLLFCVGLVMTLVYILLI